MTALLQRLDREIDATWARIHDGAFWRHLRAHGLDRDLYARLMTQIFHYTHHNAQNQALAATRADSTRLGLLRYCLHHAFEEAGHDLMVLSDLESIGVAPASVRAAPLLPETQAFIAYLYRIAGAYDPTARLGYSYWAENAYGHIRELLDAMRRDLSLRDGQMTFFVAHAALDEDHHDQVRKVLVDFCTTPALQARAVEVAQTSLWLTGQILDGTLREYLAARASGAAGKLD